MNGLDAKAVNQLVDAHAKDKPKYTKRIYSGTCICGHSWEDHHTSMVMNEDAFKATGEAYLPEECEFFGFNEMGGLDADGNNHCHRYQDKDALK